MRTIGAQRAATVSRTRRTWPKAVRLRKRREFLAVQRGGRKVHGRFFLVLVAPGAGPRGRVGITVSKRVGNAVTRNRIKRWVREYLRAAPVDAWVPRGCDVVVIAKAAAGRAADYRAVADDLAAVPGKLEGAL